MPAPRRRIPRWLPWALAALWLLLGYANLARGLAHPGVAYRPWAFSHHSYSDILAMSGDRYLGGGHPIPYLQDQIEYPVLLGLLLWIPSWLPGGQWTHFTASYLLLALCLALTLACLSSLPGASPWWLGCTPALAYYGGLNWDLLPIALLVGAVLLLERRRPAEAGAVAALGIAAKLWPMALLPSAAASLWRSDRRSLAAGGIALALVLLAVNLPFALGAPEGWSWFFRYNAGRVAENSIWEALGMKRSPAVDALALALLAAAALAAAAAALRAREEDRDRAVRLGLALVLVTWIASNKIYSPQYALYAFAAAALVSPPAWLFFLLSAMAVVDYHLAFEVRSGRALFVFYGGPYLAEEAARTAALALLAAWIVREMVRVARTPVATA